MSAPDLLATIERLYAAHPEHERALSARCGNCLRTRSRALRADPPLDLSLAALDDYPYRGSLALLLAHLPPDALASALGWERVLWAWVHLPEEGPFTEDPLARRLHTALQDAGWTGEALIQARRTVVSLHERRSAAAVERLHAMVRAASAEGGAARGDVRPLVVSGATPRGSAIVAGGEAITLDAPLGLGLWGPHRLLAVASISCGDVETLAIRRVRSLGPDGRAADASRALVDHARAWAQRWSFRWLTLRASNKLPRAEGPADDHDTIGAALGGERLKNGDWRLGLER